MNLHTARPQAHERPGIASRAFCCLWADDPEALDAIDRAEQRPPSVVCAIRRPRSTSACWPASSRPTPLPYGLGYDRQAIERIITERKDAQAMACEAKAIAGHGEIGGGHSRDYAVISASQGNRADYLTARIARDRPDILARMQRGEFRSVRAAALEAGIVRRDVRVPLEPALAAQSLIRHFDAYGLAELVTRLRGAGRRSTRPRRCRGQGRR